MANHFSIVIICKNERTNIERVLQSLQGLSNDIVVYDSGSTDGTQAILKQYGVQLFEGEWKGFGKTKQLAVSLAKNDWVLCLDADEAPDALLQQALRNVDLAQTNTIYQLAFKTFLGQKHIKWGEWGGDKHLRLFNRRVVGWNDAVVHEELVMASPVVIKKLKGHVLHHTIKDTVEYSRKMVHYALLNAEKYQALGKKSTWVKRFMGPGFAFVRHYIFGLGFLDGWEGLVVARMTAFYTFLKYARLKELQEHEEK